MRKLIVGDIHGNFRGLKQVLEKANFNLKEDLLIGIGDYVDGYSESKEVVDFLIGLEDNFVGILGNHDQWMAQWIMDPVIDAHIWLLQGGYATVHSFNKTNLQYYVDWMKSLPLYLIIDNKLIVHGGYNPKYSISKQSTHTLLWDRQLFSQSFIPKEFNEYTENDIIYDKVFIGHTTTEKFNSTKPLFSEKVIGIDTGAGWSGKLTLMDIHTLEYWQSDFAIKLYPEEKGRGR